MRPVLTRTSRNSPCWTGRTSFPVVVAVLYAACTLIWVAPVVGAETTARRQLLNPDELHDEIKVAPGTEEAVKDYFPSFLEYQDVVMFHPKFGYYSSGRVNFHGDYQTFPNALAPYFGHMVAQQVFRMWRGMRRAGTLGPGEAFSIAEFGAGNGLLAESILGYLRRQAEGSPDRSWHDFEAQVHYICYDRSPALSRAQRERNARFGSGFEAREADATDPVATIPPGSLKGVILSNELPDAFSVHKVILSADGSAEAAFVAPSLPLTRWEKLKKNLRPSVVETVEKGDGDIKRIFFAGGRDRIYLARAAFLALLEELASSADYASAVQFLEFNELYVPARLIPELAGHLRRYAPVYATELAKNKLGVVTYVNLGVEKFVQGAGRILAAGYVLTLDYGSNWEGIIAQDSQPHFRTYGPARQEENRQEPLDEDQDGVEHETSDPYRGPTLNDLTTDVNFSLMDAEGRLAGLRTVYFGPQSALRSGTEVSLTDPPQGYDTELPSDEFRYWADDFEANSHYKLMLQQKEGTDTSYSYPAESPGNLQSDRSRLSEQQREKAAVIEKRLIMESGGGAHEVFDHGDKTTAKP